MHQQHVPMRVSSKQIGRMGLVQLRAGDDGEGLKRVQCKGVVFEQQKQVVDATLGEDEVMGNALELQPVAGTHECLAFCLHRLPILYSTLTPFRIYHPIHLIQ